MGMSSLRAVAWMMRMLAWWGTSQSIALRSSPFAASASSTAPPSLVTATLKTSLPRHDDLEPRSETPRHAAAAIQQILVLTVRVQVGREHAGRIGRLEHHRARAIGEQHRGGAVAPVSDARQGLRADHQRAPRFAAAYVLVGDRQRVHEPGTGGLEAEGRPAATAQAVLQQRAAVGEHQVRRGGAESDEVDISRCDACRLQGAACRLFRQIERRLALRGDVAALDAGAAANPLIGGVDHLLQIEVGDHLLRQIRARAGDTRVNQLAAPSARSACAMCSVSPCRAASAAVAIARANATPSARPWLFTTIPASPNMHAPL